jgi:hypothetical protein
MICELSNSLKRTYMDKEWEAHCVTQETTIGEWANCCSRACRNLADSTKE